jgi:methyl-accepting chemotaxis protein
MSTVSTNATGSKAMSVSTKMFLIVAVFSLPIGVLAYLLASNYTPQIETAQLELSGNAFQKPLMQAMRGLVDAKTIVAGCPTACSAELKAANESIEPAFESIVREGARHSSELKLDRESLAKKSHQDLLIQNLHSEWNNLSADSKKAQSVEERAELAGRYEHLADELKQLVSYVGDSSTLILDPDLDSYYVVDVTLLAMPETFSRIGRSSKLANKLIAGKPSAVDEAALSNEATLLSQDLERITASNQTTLDADAGSHGVSPTLASNLTPALQGYEKALQKYVGLLKRVGANGSNVNAADFTHEVKEVNQASLEYWNTAAGELDALLQKRIDDSKTSRLQALGFSALAVLLAALVAFSLGRSITKPLERLVRDLAPGATLLGVSVERIAETSQSATPNPDEAAIICEELNAHADNMRKAVWELARHVDGASSQPEMERAHGTRS